MHSNIVPSRLNLLAILHGHKSLADELNLINVTNDFYSKFESGKKLFGNKTKINKTKLPKCFQNMYYYHKY